MHILLIIVKISQDTVEKKMVMAMELVEMHRQMILLQLLHSKNPNKKSRTIFRTDDFVSCAGNLRSGQTRRARRAGRAQRRRSEASDSWHSGDSSAACSRRHIIARPPPGRTPPQNWRKSAPQASAGRLSQRQNGKYFQYLVRSGAASGRPP